MMQAPLGPVETIAQAVIDDHLESGTDVDCLAWKTIGSCHSSILLLVKHENRTISRNGFESANPPDEARNIVRISCSIY